MRGQSTIEYTAVVALVAIVLTIGGALAGATGVTNAVGRALIRALCQVTGSGCAAVRLQPCVVRTTTVRGGVTARVVLVRIGRDSAVIRSERSDGTIDVTLLDDLSAGLRATLGARGRVVLGDTALGAGAVAEATLVASLGGGRTWRVRGRAATRRLERRIAQVLVGRTASALPGVGVLLDLGQRILRKGAHVRLPEPHARTLSGGVKAELGVLLGPLEDVSGGLGVVVGRRRERGGAWTWFTRLTGDARTPLASAVGLDAAATGEVSLALAVDMRGRPKTLTVSAAGTLSRGTTLAGFVGPAGKLGGAKRAQISAMLDLSDAADRALVSAVAHGRPGALRALAAAVADHAAIDVATYDEQRRGVSFDVAGGIGAGVGVGIEASRLGQRLTGAWSRPPRGAWETRLDCVRR